ncbi:MAG: DUF3179 domain-containing protein, partial [Acidobacteriota bacterium]|nr:DUF3179 domain-containing protein [Acidobacteriota bacterium]
MPAPPRCSRRAIAPLLALWIAATCSPATAAAPADDRAVDTVSRRIAGREVAYAHPPLDEPEVRSIATADHMRSTDIVAGVISGGASRAYPWWVLKNHHAVNDTLGNEAILIAFCEQCSAATGFLRTLGDRVLAMDTEGVVNGTIVLRDRETGTLWAPFDGEGLEGPLVGERLARIPVFLTTWGDWQRRHPATDVLYGRAELREGHGSREHPGQWGVVGEMGETLRSWDTRLAENELVYGTTVGEEARAYPFRTVR